MKPRLVCAALFVMVSWAAPAAPQQCPPEDPTVACGFHCVPWDTQCWGPAEPTRACASYAGCADWNPSDLCSCGGGF